MTVPGQTAYRNRDPHCATCMDTGVDLVFETPCTECHEADVIAETRERIAQRWRERFPPRTYELERLNAAYDERQRIYNLGFLATLKHRRQQRRQRTL